MNNIENKVKSIIANQLGIKEEEILNHFSFTKDLGADSLDTIELIMALEDKFNIEITDEDAEKIVTVQSAIDFIQSKSHSSL